MLNNKLLGCLFFCGMLGVLVKVNTAFQGVDETIFGIYGLLMVSYFIGKKLLSLMYRPYTNTPLNKKVSVIMPFYNEDCGALHEMLQSILAQTYPVHEVFIIDDGSRSASNYETVLKLKDTDQNTRIIAHRFPENRGKRVAQAWAFERATGEIFFTVDSDSYLYPDALTELMRPFSDETVMAVTGRIQAKNKQVNFFTQLLNMRYEHAFRIERGAQSLTRNVLVCSGPISCYRKEIILDNLPHYLSQTFLGKRVQSGDDRCLTNYAILKGKTIYQSGARCDTTVPTTVLDFFKQQIRWNKSFLRETLRTLNIGFKKPVVVIWVIFEIIVWILFGLVFLLSFCLHIQSFKSMLFIYYLSSVFLTLYTNTGTDLFKHGLTLLVAPLYGIIHLVMLFPLRCYALLTIRKNNWETR